MGDFNDQTPTLTTDLTAAQEAGEPAPRRRFEDLPPPAQRALREAEARRREIDERQKAAAREIDGRGGLDPARYDDWEIKGLAVDF